MVSTAPHKMPFGPRDVIVAPRTAPGQHGREQGAMEAKSAAMGRAFGRDSLAAENCSFEARMMSRVLGVVSQVPGLQEAPRVLKGFGRYGGPFFATGAFVFGGVETARNWKRMDAVGRGFGVATTLASGLAATTAIASLCCAGVPLAVVGGAAGLAGTLFAAGAVREAFHDDHQNAGQRGLTVTALGFQALGMALALTPMGGLGVASMIVGAHFSVFAGLLGKRPSVERFFKRLGFTDGAHANDPAPRHRRHFPLMHPNKPRPANQPAPGSLAAQPTQALRTR